MAFRGRSVFIRHIRCVSANTHTGPGKNSPDHKHIPFVDEPYGSKGWEVLNGHSLLVIVVVPFHRPSSQVVPSIMLDSLGPRSQDSSTLSRQDLISEPVENLFIQPVAARYRDRRCKESRNPPVYFESHSLEVLQGSRYCAEDGQSRSEGGEINLEPGGKERLQKSKSRCRTLEDLLNGVAGCSSEK